ncbi:pyridoxal phosphate-dependent aminotransferase [Streptomyces coffeae]|uniref:Aminotransferase n=1 Tax=Streptomyces coffeae TaxID=621382 RepID=A0ABS1ND69_9ACTN|nr:pyridoxal phosphate-dependent aminotransferase [Streptomyces coffeae]MBL1097899.1 pyridoxal phosphate-dependent aminotransferase [Streptomyces coffeae]
MAASAPASASAEFPPAAGIPPSCLHDVFRAADALERETGRPVNQLHVGEPSFRMPPEVAEGLTKAITDGRTTYTSAEGMPRLREALTAKLETENGHHTTPDRVFVSPGSCQGLAALLQSIATPGAELLLPEVHWPIHLQQALLAGFRPVFYPLRADLGVDIERLADVSGPRTRAIVVNTPSNPTGAVLEEAELRRLLALAEEHNWYVISDEAYEHFVYEGQHVSLASLERDLPPDRRRVFSTYSFSKSYAMTGCRLGYVVTPNDVTASALRVVQEASIIAPATPVQYAGLAALDAHAAVRRHREMVRAARDEALPMLVTAGLLDALPAGGWYALLDVGRTGMDANTFAEGLLAATDVAVAPATGFALRPVVDNTGRVTEVGSLPMARHLVRVAICGDRELLCAGVRALVDFASQR